MRVDTRDALLVAAAASLLALFGCGTLGHVPAAAGSAEADADLSKVSEVRRQLRSACGKLRTAGADAAQADALLRSAAGETDRALTLWQEFRRQHADGPPAVYAAHSDWDSAAHDVEEGIREMLQEAVAEHPTEAFQVCGRTCGMFVDMNTKAGVRRTSDVLFMFRKAAKPLAEPAKSGELVPLREAIPRLLQLRDDALADPVGGTGAPEQKRQPLASFSEAVDAFVQAVQEEKVDELAQRYDAMMKAMEQAYDLFL